LKFQTCFSTPRWRAPVFQGNALRHFSFPEIRIAMVIFSSSRPRRLIFGVSIDNDTPGTPDKNKVFRRSAIGNYIKTFCNDISKKMILSTNDVITKHNADKNHYVYDEPQKHKNGNPCKN